MNTNYIAVKQCRSCLSQIPESHCFSLDVIGFGNLTFRAMFETALGYEVLPHEPQTFCDVCVNNLVEWQSFKATCENTQKLLTTSVKVEEEEPEECHSESLYTELSNYKMETEVDFMDSELGTYQQEIENKNEELESGEEMLKITLKAFVKKYKSEPLKCCLSMGLITIKGIDDSEIMHKIGQFVNPYLKQEIIYEDNKPQWSECKEEDIERFIMFQDHVAMRTYTRPGLNIFKNWDKKQPFLFIYPYGKNIRTIHQYRIIEDTLLNNLPRKTKQKSHIKTSNEPEETLEEIFVPENCLEIPLRLKFEVLIRSFRKQSKKTAVDPIICTVGGRDLNDLKKNLWIAVKPHLVRGIDMSDEQNPSWHPDPEPREDDMTNYVDIRNVRSKLIISVEKLNLHLLTSWHNKKLILYIYPYSKNVDTAAHWEVVKRFLNPNTDSTDVKGPEIRLSGVKALVSELKVAHETKYPTTADTNWIMWAHYIDCYDKEQQERLLQEGPPTQLLPFFDKNCNEFPPGKKTETVFSFSTLVIVKQAKFSKNCMVLGRFTFCGDTVEEIQNSIWQQCSPFLVREIIFKEDGKPEWAAKEHPTRDDLSKFVYISDKKKKSSYSLNDLTETCFKRWQKRGPKGPPILYINQFTSSVKSLPLFQSVKKNLLQSSENAATCTDTKELIEQLQTQHQNLISFDCHWRMWVHYLQGFRLDKSYQLDLKQPPKELSHLFVDKSLQDLINQIPEEMEESDEEKPVDPYELLNIPKDADKSQLMTCPFEGCASAFRISSYGHHYKYCRFNPNVEYTDQCKFEKCQKVFTENWYKEKHERICQFNPDRKTKELKQCPHCEKISINLKEHIKYHHATKPNSVFICDLCGAQRNTKGTIKSHMSVHIEPKYMCDQCSAKFKQESSLRDHISRDHTDNLKLKYKCKYCAYKTHASYNLSRHFKQNHDSTRPRYICSECGKEFKNNVRLKAHMAIHADTEFCCEVCSHVCRTEKALRFHMTLHQDYKYECPVCQIKRRSAYEVRMHCQRKHPNYKLPPKFTVMKLTSKFKGKTLLSK